MGDSIAIPEIRYRELISRIPYGKILPEAVYVHRHTEVCTAGDIGKLLQSLARSLCLNDSFNVVKFRTSVPRISFLSYPHFFEIPHPELEESVSIDLETGKSYRIGYQDNINPPILHRKELFLSPDHPQWSTFASLSAEEERAGLFDNSYLIGFRLNWERLLASRGLAVEGHQLVECNRANAYANSGTTTELNRSVQRHRTALTRYDISKPVKTLIEFDQMQPGCSFFDYGCGLGTDIRGLQELGYDASGWDPIHAPSGLRKPADVVNLGYILNVIEDPAERAETLLHAWRLTRRLLVVSALIGDAASNRPNGVPMNDGVLTRRNTFQKYFSQKELQNYIEDVLDVPAVPVAVGIFYVFSNTTAHELFVQSRSRRAIAWKALGIDFGTSGRSRERVPDMDRPTPSRKRGADPFVTHRELAESFWSCVLSLGRLPLPIEFAEHSQVCQVFGSPNRVLRRLLKANGTDLFSRAQAARRADLLVYLAMAPLRKIVPFNLLPESIRHDIHTFFHNYKSALAEGLALLYSAGDANNIALACEETEIGWQDDRSLYIQTSIMDRVPTVLRTLVACAECLSGSALDADIIRVHKQSFKVTFLSYSNFASSLLPRLVRRVRVHLSTQQLDVFDQEREGQLLYFKERFASSEEDVSPELQRLSLLLRQLGVSDQVFVGPSAAELAALLKEACHGDLVKSLQLEREDHDA